jgi:hypothetical protein
MYCRVATGGGVVPLRRGPSTRKGAASQRVLRRISTLTHTQRKPPPDSIHHLDSLKFSRRQAHSLHKVLPQDYRLQILRRRCRSVSDRTRRVTQSPITSLQACEDAGPARSPLRPRAGNHFSPSNRAVQVTPATQTPVRSRHPMPSVSFPP